MQFLYSTVELKKQKHLTGLMTFYPNEIFKELRRLYVLFSGLFYQSHIHVWLVLATGHIYSTREPHGNSAMELGDLGAVDTTGEIESTWTQIVTRCEIKWSTYFNWFFFYFFWISKQVLALLAPR